MCGEALRWSQHCGIYRTPYISGSHITKSLRGSMGHWPELYSPSYKKAPILVGAFRDYPFLSHPLVMKTLGQILLSVTWGEMSVDFYGVFPSIHIPEQKLNQSLPSSAFNPHHPLFKDHFNQQDQACFIIPFLQASKKSINTENKISLFKDCKCSPIGFL